MKGLIKFTKVVEEEILHCFTVNTVHKLYVYYVNRLLASDIIGT